MWSGNDLEHDINTLVCLNNLINKMVIGAQYPHQSYIFKKFAYKFQNNILCVSIALPYEYKSIPIYSFSFPLLPLYRINFNLSAGAHSGFGQRRCCWVEQKVVKLSLIRIKFSWILTVLGTSGSLGKNVRRLHFWMMTALFPSATPAHSLIIKCSQAWARAPAQCIRDWRSAYIMNKCRESARSRVRERGRKEGKERNSTQWEASVILLPLLLLTSRQSFFGGKLTWKHSSARVNQTFESLLCILNVPVRAFRLCMRRSNNFIVDRKSLFLSDASHWIG